MAPALPLPSSAHQSRSSIQPGRQAEMQAEVRVLCSLHCAECALLMRSCVLDKHSAICCRAPECRMLKFLRERHAVGELLQGLSDELHGCCCSMHSCSMTQPALLHRTYRRPCCASHRCLGCGKIVMQPVCPPDQNLMPACSPVDITFRPSSQLAARYRTWQKQERRASVMA